MSKVIAYCNGCRKSQAVVYEWKVVVGAARHLVQRCRECRAFIRMVPQEPEYLSLVEELAPPLPSETQPDFTHKVSRLWCESCKCPVFAMAQELDSRCLYCNGILVWKARSPARTGGSPLKGVNLCVSPVAVPKPTEPRRPKSPARKTRPEKPVVYEEVENCTILKETERAFLVLCLDDQVWVPKSLVKDAWRFKTEVFNVTMEVADWFARKELI